MARRCRPALSRFVALTALVGAAFLVGVAPYRAGSVSRRSQAVPGRSSVGARPAVQQPTLRLGKLRAIELSVPVHPTEQETATIKHLIASLADISAPDYGISPTMSGQAFAPIPGSARAGAFVLANHGLTTSPAVRELVRLGPRSLPLLLGALEDPTPTKLTIRQEGIITMLSFESEMWGKPLNSAEQWAIASACATRRFAEGSSGGHDDSYTVKVGDVCFVIIGEIVGRPYAAVRYQPSGILVVNCPVEDATIAQRARAIWASANPAQHLLDSLLRDYATEGVFNGEDLGGGWDVASELQTAAAMRLLYYFPHQSASFLAARLHRLHIGVIPVVWPLSRDAEAHAGRALMRREVTNGVRTTGFVKAVAWCTEPTVRSELFRIFARTTDPEILLASLPAIGPEHTRLVRTRIERFLRALPATEGGPYGDGYNLLVALGQRPGVDARPVFRRYLRVRSVQRCLTLCYVLRETHGEWAVELLEPLLSDRRAVFGAKHVAISQDKGPPLPLRVCDEAAATISHWNADLPFRWAGTPGDLDRQIRTMKRHIRQRLSGRGTSAFHRPRWAG